MEAPEKLPTTAPSAQSKWVIPLTAAGFAFFVAAGARVMALFAASMMSGVALIGAWLILMAGLAYGGVRLRPAWGGAMFAGLGVGAVAIVFFGGMQMVS